MHDFDRTQLEASETELGNEQEFGESAPGATQGEGAESPLHENLEIELATELLEVGSEFELEADVVIVAVGNAPNQLVPSTTPGIVENS